MIKSIHHIILLFYFAFFAIIFHHTAYDVYASNIEAPDSVEKSMPTQQIEALRLQQDNLWDNFKNLEKKYNDLEKERVDLKSLEKQGVDVAIDDIKTRQSSIITQQKI